MLIAWVCLLGLLAGDDAPPGPSPLSYQVRVAEMDGLGWREEIYHRMEPAGEDGVARAWTAGPAEVAAIARAARSCRELRGVATAADEPVKLVQRIDRNLITGLERKADGPPGAATFVAFAPVVKPHADGVELTISGRAEAGKSVVRAVVRDTRIGTVHDVSLTETVGKPDAGPRTVRPHFQLPEVHTAAIEGRWTIEAGRALVFSMGVQTKYDDASKSATVGERLVIVEVEPGATPPRATGPMAAAAPAHPPAFDAAITLVKAPTCCPAAACEAAPGELAMPATPSRTFPAGRVIAATIDPLARPASADGPTTPSPQARPFAESNNLVAWTEGPRKPAIPAGVALPKLVKAHKVMVTALTTDGAGQQVGFDMDLRPDCDPAAVRRMSVPADVQVYSVKVVGTPEGETRPMVVLDMLVRDGQPVAETPGRMLAHAAENWMAGVVDLGVSLAEFVGDRSWVHEVRYLSLRDAFTSAIMHGDAARVVAEPRPAGPGESSPLLIAPAGSGNVASTTVDAAALLVEVERRYWALDAAQIALSASEQVVQEADEARAAYAQKCAGKVDPRIVADVNATIKRLRQDAAEVKAAAGEAEVALGMILGMSAEDARGMQTSTPPLGEFEVEDYETCLKSMRERSPSLVARRRAARAAELRAQIAAEPIFAGQDADAMAAHGLPAVDPDAARDAAARAADGLRQAEHEASHQLAGRYIDADSAARGLKTARRLREASRKRVAAERTALAAHPERVSAYLDALQSCASSDRTEAEFIGRLNRAVAEFELTKGTFLEHAHVAVATRPADAEVSRTAFEPPMPAASPAFKFNLSVGPFLKSEVKGEPPRR